jgi:Uma2 family endonuclease
MNVQVAKAMDSSAFLAWAEGREGRYELANGRVIMMTGGSRAHALIVRRLANALERQLDGGRWTVLTSDFAARIDPKTVRYPDVIVDKAGEALRDLAATSPVLIAEVLSPSSVATDLGDKAAEYLQLAGLAAYLVLSQDEAKAWVWARADAKFPAGSEVVAGADGVVRLPALSLELPLAEIYAGFTPEDGKN